MKEEMFPFVVKWYYNSKNVHLELKSEVQSQNPLEFLIY